MSPLATLLMDAAGDDTTAALVGDGEGFFPCGCRGANLDTGDDERHRAVGCTITMGNCGDASGGDGHSACFCSTCRITMLGDECLEGTVRIAQGNGERTCSGDALRADLTPVSPVDQALNGVTDAWSVLRSWIIGVVGLVKLTLFEWGSVFMASSDSTLLRHGGGKQ